MKITRKQLRQLIQEELRSVSGGRQQLRVNLMHTGSSTGILADYHVQPGDRLNDIVTNFVRKQFTIDHVLEVNPDITDPNVISAGDVIKIPIDTAPYQTVGDQLMTIDHPAVTQSRRYTFPGPGGHGEIFSFFDPVGVEEKQAVDDFYRDQTGY